MRARLGRFGRGVLIGGLAGAVLAGWLALPGPVLAQAAPTAVQLDSRDGTPLQAWLFRPPGPVRGTVVALHGCGGLYATTGARRGLLNARHQAMADLLLSRGYAVLFPDSLTPRGETEICTQKTGQRRIDGSHRRGDAQGALAWAAAQPWARADRLVLLGWSHGGSAVLSSIDASRADVATQTVQPLLAVAFYPGCSDAVSRRSWKPLASLTILIGALDDWTPAAPCVQLGERSGDSPRAHVVVYPDSYHDFDNPVGEVRVRRDVPNGTHPGQGVHAGRNPIAREQAYALLMEKLDAAMPAAVAGGGATSSTNPAVRR